MSGRTPILLVILASFALAGMFVVPTWLARLDYEVLSSETSPSGGFTLTALRSTSEGGEAPYGQYLILSGDSETYTPSDGHVLFAGYCNTELSFAWKSDREVVVHCRTNEPSPVSTLSRRFRGVEVRFNLEPSGL